MHAAFPVNINIQSIIPDEVLSDLLDDLAIVRSAIREYETVTTTNCKPTVWRRVQSRQALRAANRILLAIDDTIGQWKGEAEAWIESEDVDTEHANALRQRVDDILWGWLGRVEVTRQSLDHVILAAKV